MLYEVHVTVASDDADRWQDFCRRRNIKPLLIELAEGDHPRQLMCAAVYKGDDGGARAFAAGLEREVEAEKFPILRSKIECPLAGHDRPSATVYYECHIKLELRTEQVPAAAELCRNHGFSLSRELLSKGPDIQKYYLTERHYEGEPEEVRERFRLALARVRERLPVRAMDMERVLTDSNPDIDKGWAEKK